MCDRLGLGVLALGPAAMFAVLVILAITTVAGACGRTYTAAADGATAAGGSAGRGGDL
jgi:hypothetical protein